MRESMPIGRTYNQGYDVSIICIGYSSSHEACYRGYRWARRGSYPRDNLINLIAEALEFDDNPTQQIT